MKKKLSIAVAAIFLISAVLNTGARVYKFINRYSGDSKVYDRNNTVVMEKK